MASVIGEYTGTRQVKTIYQQIPSHLRLPAPYQQANNIIFVIFQLDVGLVQSTVSTHVIVWMVLCVTPPRETVRPVVMTETPTLTCGEEPGAGQAVKWVSVSNGYMWRGGWGRPGCQVGVSNGYMWRRNWSGPGCQVGKCQ